MEIISAIIFALGLSYGIFKYGLLDSVSAYYYKLSPSRNFLFGLWCMAYALPIWYATSSIWLQLAAICVIVVGIAAAYKGDKLINYVHYMAAILAVVFGYLHIGIHFSVGIALIASFITLLIRFSNSPRAVLYAEIFAIITILTTSWVF